MKEIGEIFGGMIEQDAILCNALVVIVPGIGHLCKLPVVDADPSIKDARDHLQQEDDDQLGLAQTRIEEEPASGNEPREKDQVTSEQQVLQWDGFLRCKIAI